MKTKEQILPLEIQIQNTKRSRKLRNKRVNSWHHFITKYPYKRIGEKRNVILWACECECGRWFGAQGSTIEHSEGLRCCGHCEPQSKNILTYDDDFPFVEEKPKEPKQEEGTITKHGMSPGELPKLVGLNRILKVADDTRDDKVDALSHLLNRRTPIQQMDAILAQMPEDDRYAALLLMEARAMGERRRRLRRDLKEAGVDPTEEPKQRTSD